MTVAVVGATGYTGRLVCAELARRETGFIAVGRDPAKLEQVAEATERRVADVTDERLLVRTLDGASVVISCAGPFVDVGEPVVRASVAVGAHYLDTTGEQGFMRMVYEHYDEPARGAGVRLVTAVGFDWVPGDMAAALAVRALGRPADRVEAHYLLRRAKVSHGTRRTGLRVGARPCLVVRGGTLVEDAIGSSEHRFTFDAEEAAVALWPGGEPLTVPRWCPEVRHVATYFRMPKAAAAMLRRAPAAESLLRAGGAVVGATGVGPSPDERERGSYEVVVDVSNGGDRARCVVRGRDMYGLTAAACAEGALRLRSDSETPAGALAPSQAWDPDGFLGSLGRFLTYEVSGP